MPKKARWLSTFSTKSEVFAWLHEWNADYQEQNIHSIWESCQQSLVVARILADAGLSYEWAVKDYKLVVIETSRGPLMIVRYKVGPRRLVAKAAKRIRFAVGAGLIPLSTAERALQELPA